MKSLALEHLPVIASAPGGVKKLRELILQLAVMGKLVPQDTNDEPASDLLRRIQSERMTLLKAGLLKAEKNPPVVSATDHPYQLPNSWVWVKLGSLTSKIGAGSTPLGGKQGYLKAGIKFLRSQNVWDEGLYLDDVAFIPPHVHEKMAGTHVKPGDLLFNITGASIGRCAIVPGDFDTGNVSQHVTIVRPLLTELQMFLHKVLISGQIQKAVMSEQVGVSREGLSISKLSQFLIPLPPLAEQHRIVAKVDELMDLCDKLEAQQNDSEAAHRLLVKTLLDTLTQTQDADDFAASWERIKENFHTLFTTEESVDILKQTILQLAVTRALGSRRSDWTFEKASSLCSKVQSGKTPKEGFTDTPGVPFLKVYNIVRQELDFEYRPQFIPTALHK